MTDIIRRCIFRPYKSGMGPTFTLSVCYANRSCDGRDYLSYELWQVEQGKRWLLFAGSDYSPSPLVRLDSDASMADLMSFLTQKTGDTDAELFADYTPEQLAFCEQHAGCLAGAVACRFGETD